MIQRTALLALVATLASQFTDARIQQCENDRRYVTRHGDVLDLSSFPSSLEGASKVNVTTVDEAKQLYYVRNFASKEEAEKLAGLCGDPDQEVRVRRSLFAHADQCPPPHCSLDLEELLRPQACLFVAVVVIIVLVFFFL
jgi:hypothetical protein